MKAGLEDLAAAVLAAPDGPAGVTVGLAYAGAETVVSAGHLQVFDDAGPLSGPLPMTPTAAHDIGSVTKVVATTTMLMAKAVDPSWPARDLVGAAPAGVTLEHLLRHRAGLWEWWPTYAAGARTPAAALRVVGDLPPRYRVDTGRHYSDLGFMLLGGALEVVTGLTLPAAFDQLVGGPFGLPHTTYGAPVVAEVAGGQVGDEIERRMIATGVPYPVPRLDFCRWRTHVLAGEVGDGNAFHAFGGAAGHAGLFTTAGDLLRWGNGLLGSLRGDGPLPAAAVTRFLAPGPDAGQRLGFRSRVLAGCEVFEHPGFPGAGVAVVPDDEAVVVLFANRLHRRGPPPAFAPWWDTVLERTHAMIHEEDLCG